MIIFDIWLYIKPLDTTHPYFREEIDMDQAQKCHALVKRTLI